MKKLISPSYCLGLAAYSTLSMLFTLSVLVWDTNHRGIQFPLIIREAATVVLTLLFIASQIVFWIHLRGNSETDPSNEERHYRELLCKIAGLNDNAARVARDLAANVSLEKIASAEQAARIEFTGKDTNRRVTNLEEWKR